MSIATHEEHKRTHDEMVPGPPGLQVPGGPQAGQGTRQHRCSVPPRGVSGVGQRQPEASSSGEGVWQPGSKSSGQMAQRRGGGWRVPPISPSRHQREPITLPCQRNREHLRRWEGKKHVEARYYPGPDSEGSTSGSSGSSQQGRIPGRERSP